MHSKKNHYFKSFSSAIHWHRKCQHHCAVLLMTEFQNSHLSRLNSVLITDCFSLSPLATTALLPGHEFDRSVGLRQLALCNTCPFLFLISLSVLFWKFIYVIPLEELYSFFSSIVFHIFHWMNIYISKICKSFLIAGVSDS